MSIVKSGEYRELIGGTSHVLKLTNAEIERFEDQYPDLGFYAFWEQLKGRAGEPLVRHCRDIIALGLVGGGMADRQADRLIADQPPGENMRLRQIAFNLVGITLIPAVLDDAPKKKAAGSRGRKPRSKSPKPTTGPETASETSAA